MLKRLCKISGAKQSCDKTEFLISGGMPIILGRTVWTADRGLQVEDLTICSFRGGRVKLVCPACAAEFRCWSAASKAIIAYARSGIEKGEYGRKHFVIKSGGLPIGEFSLFKDQHPIDLDTERTLIALLEDQAQDEYEESYRSKI